MSNFSICLLISVGLLLTGIIFWVIGALSNAREWAMGAGIVALILGALAIIPTLYLRTYLAGQGDASEFAQEWSQKWRPGSTFECQEYDSDSNGYVSCTVGWTKLDGTSEVEAIECGINKWYAGFRNKGCRLMKGFSGSQ